MTPLGQNDIELTDSTISRDQARIVYEGATRTFRLVNESTINPARVNGQTVDSVALKDGDTVEFGSTVVMFSASPTP